MGIRVTWETTCDGCGLMVEKTLVLDDKTAHGCEEHEDGVTTYFNDIWSPGWPDDWIETIIEKDEDYRPEPDRAQYFFHSEECLKDWLRKHGQEKKAEEFDKAIWVA